MTSRIKRLIFSKVLDIAKSGTNVNFSPDVSASVVSVGSRNNGRGVEFCIPLTNLRKLFPDISPDLCLQGFRADEVCHSCATSEKRTQNIVFQIDKNIFIKDIVENVLQSPQSFWKRSDIFATMNPETVVVDFSSPNIAKPFHMGHLRSTIIGNFISNLNQALGHKVVKLNYLGDWGTQFGLLKVGLDMSGYTDEMVRKNPIKLLFEAYVLANKEAESNPQLAEKARKVFKELEEGSEDGLERWKLYRNYTVEELERTYSRLGVSFNEYHWESMYRAKEIKSVLNSLERIGLLSSAADGKKIIQVQPNQNVTVVKSDGTTLYLTRDIAAAVDRQEKYLFDKMFYVVDNGQSNHFIALFNILSKMDYPWASKLGHVRFGRIKGMSTRKGSVVFLSDILDEAKDIMKQKQMDSPSINKGCRSRSN